MMLELSVTGVLKVQARRGFDEAMMECSFDAGKTLSASLALMTSQEIQSNILTLR